MFAFNVQVPVATSVTVKLDTVQTPVVPDVKVTVKPLLAVTLTTKAPEVTVRSATVPNVMVWFAFPKVTVVATEDTEL
jgi:hypothetical protein